jgi:hypothetical protein
MVASLSTIFQGQDVQLNLGRDCTRVHDWGLAHIKVVNKECPFRFLYRFRECCLSRVARRFGLVNWITCVVQRAKFWLFTWFWRIVCLLTTVAQDSVLPRGRWLRGLRLLLVGGGKRKLEYSSLTLLLTVSQIVTLELLPGISCSAITIPRGVHGDCRRFHTSGDDGIIIWEIRQYFLASEIYKCVTFLGIRKKRGNDNKK